MSRTYLRSLLILIVLQFSFCASSNTFYQVEDKSDFKNIHSNSMVISLNNSQLSKTLDATENEITLPTPDGNQVTFLLTESNVMPRAMREKYPNVRAFRGIDKDNSQQKGSFEFGPNGFHAMFDFESDKVFIDPIRGYKNFSQVYFRSDARGQKFTESERMESILQNTSLKKRETNPRTLSTYEGDEIPTRTFKLAVATSGEYTEFHGGSKENGLAAVVTSVNRISQVYESDFGISFQLAEDNDIVIYTDPDDDPYANDSDEDLDNVMTDLAENIGSENFDIGHLFNTSTDGGVAYVGVVCDDNYKGGGLSGLPQPIGDSFSVDYVGHEIGHQFGANHTFNSCDGAESSRNEDTAYEVGSGVTIMSYLGACSTTNLKASPGYDYFHSASVDEIKTNLDSYTCGATSDSSNITPTVTISSPSDVTIPINTPFELSGNATDSDGQNLSYSWEQFDIGASSSSKDELGDNGNRPIFRNWELSDSTTRSFPRIEDVIDGTFTDESGFYAAGEFYPTTSREMNFRLVARDSQGGISYESIKINSTNTAGPFSVTSPTISSSYNGGEEVTINWDVANTDQPPVNCIDVSISFLQSSSATPETLVSSTPNDGSAAITMPNYSTQTGHIKVACNDNVFYALSDAFSLSAGEGQATPRYDFDNDSRADMLYRGETDLTWRMDLMNGSTVLESLVPSGMSTCCGWLFNGVGDFNGDGNDDVIIRNTQSGNWYIYNLDKNSVISRGYVAIEDAVKVGVQAIADFNNDGLADVLLRNEETGEWTMSLLNNRNIISEISPAMSQVLSWNIVDANDFDGNGSADILIRNSSSGAWYIYLYDSLDITTRGYISTMTTDLDNEVKAVADYDGDGKSDVLFRNRLTGQWEIVFMDGRTPISTTEVLLTTDPNWEFNASDDYNGDGYADISIRNGESIEFYFMFGSTISSQAEGSISVPTDMYSVSLIN